MPSDPNQTDDLRDALVPEDFGDQGGYPQVDRLKMRDLNVATSRLDAKLREDARYFDTMRDRDVTDETHLSMSGSQGRVLLDVLTERMRQDEKWGLIRDRLDLSEHDGWFDAWRQRGEELENVARASLTHLSGNWAAVLAEEVGEALREVGKDRDALRKELIQVAAVCVAWVEAMDQGGAK